MNINDLQWNWNQFGKIDPLYAILTNPEKRNNRWDVNEFFTTGQNEVKDAIRYLSSLNLQVQYGRALDFGCGVGRLTQALCAYFQQCDGVDIAASMVQRAREYNKYGDRCHYHVNTVDNLRLFDKESFDFIYSMIVLQHIEPKYSTQYIEEFIRILKPGGIAIFQLPSDLFISPSSPLPEEAYRAKISISDPPFKLPANKKIPVRVHVKNTSLNTWHGANGCFLDYPIQLGNRWLKPDGSVVMANDARAKLQKDLAPGEEIDLELTVSSPKDDGEYILELDMVQERVCWFHQKGSSVYRLPVWVTSETASILEQDQAAHAESTPRAEMHCLPKQTIIDLVQSHGVSIIDISDDFMARPAYIGYRYCISKDPKFLTEKVNAQ